MDNQRLVTPAKEDFRILRSPNGGLFASTGANYQQMVFARDAIEAAEDLFDYDSHITRGVLDELSRNQGVTHNIVSGEEPGKIAHQHMQLFMGGKRISHSAEALMHRLSAKWGGDEKGFTNYNSVDATPLYARLMARYALSDKDTHFLRGLVKRDGRYFTRKECLLDALQWISDTIDRSDIGVLQYKRELPSHIIVQSWRDSGSSFVHENGRQANLKSFIAPLEVQGYAYDALKYGAKALAGEPDVTDAQLYYWDHLAKQVRQATLEHFWMPDKHAFAMGLDRDAHGKPRQVTTPSSSQGVLLDSDLLLDLPDDARKKYVGGIVRTLYSDDFMTDIGIRCRSRRYARLTGFADYHGAWAVWAKETYDFAKGLRRQGFEDLPTDLENRILNMVTIAGKNYELLYVDPESGNVDYNPTELPKGTKANDNHRIIISTWVPETGQAWTVSAVIAIRRRHTRTIWKKFLPEAVTEVIRGTRPRWMEQLEDEIEAKIGFVERVTSRKDIEAERKSAVRYFIDTKQGIEFDRKWNPDWWSDQPA